MSYNKIPPRWLHCPRRGQPVAGERPARPFWDPPPRPLGLATGPGPLGEAVGRGWQRPCSSALPPQHLPFLLALTAACRLIPNPVGPLSRLSLARNMLYLGFISVLVPHLVLLVSLKFFVFLQARLLLNNTVIFLSPLSPPFFPLIAVLPSI